MLALTFGNSSLLWLLLLVPVMIAGYVVAQRRRPKYAARFTNLELLSTVVPRTPNWRRHIAPAIYVTALATLLVAVSRPIIVKADPTQQATVMLVLDTSGSMVATDVQPTRLAAAQQSARGFLDEVPSAVKVGLVSFASEARLLAAPTTNRDTVRQGLASLNAVGATAMGDAITLAMNAATGTPTDFTQSPTGPSTTPPPVKTPTVLLVLSDGKNTLGNDPVGAADLAKQRGIKVDTIALGTQDGVANISDGNGGVVQIPVPPDTETLQTVAQHTGGQFFTAPTAAQLRSVYANLGSRIAAEKHRHEITSWLAAVAVALLLAGAGVSLTLFNRFP